MRLGMSDGTFNSVYTPSKLMFCLAQRMGNLWSLNVYDVNMSMSFEKKKAKVHHFLFDFTHYECLCV